MRWLRPCRMKTLQQQPLQKLSFSFFIFFSLIINNKTGVNPLSTY